MQSHRLWNHKSHQDLWAQRRSWSCGNLLIAFRWHFIWCHRIKNRVCTSAGPWTQQNWELIHGSLKKKCLAKLKYQNLEIGGDFSQGTSQVWQINKVRFRLQPTSQNFNPTFWGHRKISIICDSIWKGDLRLWVDKGYSRLGAVTGGSCGPWPAGTIHNLLDQTLG